MSEALRSVLSAALELPKPEREILVWKLMESVSTREGWEEIGPDQFYAELARRRQECLDGTDGGVPLEQVRAGIEKELND